MYYIHVFNLFWTLVISSLIVIFLIIVAMHQKEESVNGTDQLHSTYSTQALHYVDTFCYNNSQLFCPH